MIVLKVVGTLVLMVVGGVAAFAATAFSLIELGSELHHGNREYYTEYPHSHGIALCFVIGAIGFLTPGFIVWKRHNFAEYKIPSQFGLRTLFITMTLFAVLLVIIAWIWS